MKIDTESGSVIQPMEVAAIIALHIGMYASVWWFDWRLGLAWACHGTISDLRKEFAARKPQQLTSRHS